MHPTRLLVVAAAAVVVAADDTFVPFGDVFSGVKRSTSNDDDARIGLAVSRHDTCTFREGKFEPTIEFDNQSVVRPNPSVGAGCYSVSGRVRVVRDLLNPLHIYVETRILPLHRKRPMQCYGDEAASGCGGFGSCVYCDSCKLQQQIHGATLTRNGEQLACGTENNENGIILEAGTHDDVTLSFCMPTKGEFKSALNLTEESWQSVIQAEAPNGEIENKRRMFMVMYVFNKDLSSLSRKQRLVLDRRTAFRDDQILEKWRADNERLIANGLPPLPRPETGYPLDLSDAAYNSLPIPKEVHITKSFIGCHKISGTIFFDGDTADAPTTARTPPPTRGKGGRRNSNWRG